MKKMILLAAIAASLMGCQEGLKVGKALKDCAAIAPNQREDAAREIKLYITRSEKISALVKKFNITPEAADECLEK